MPWIQLFGLYSFRSLCNPFGMPLEHLDFLLDNLFWLTVELVNLILLGLLWRSLNGFLIFGVEVLTFNHKIIPNFTLRWFMPVSLIPSATRASILVALQNLPRIGAHFLGEHSILLTIPQTASLFFLDGLNCRVILYGLLFLILDSQLL